MKLNGYKNYIKGSDMQKQIALVIVICFVLNVLPTVVTIEDVYKKTDNFSPEYLDRIYTSLCDQRKVFFGEQIAFFSCANSIEQIPYKKYFGDMNTVKRQIAKDALTTHAIVHKKVLQLINNLINCKSTYSKLHATFFEKYKNKQYDYIHRLLTKRPMYFFGSNDCYGLPFSSNSVIRKEDIDGFIEDKMSDLAIQNYISYDEMCISALVGLCSPTFCINDGNRNNSCVFDPHIQRALYCGLVGARFERPGFMEWQHIIIDPEQNTKINGYGKKLNDNLDKDRSFTYKNELLAIWASFYGIDYFPTYDEVVTYVQNNPDQTDYIPLYDASKKYECLFFNTAVYKKRLQYTITPFLYNASQYGKSINKKIYVHATGLGTGVWGEVSKNGQAYKPDAYESFKDMLYTLQIQCYINCLEKNKELWNTIGTIDFSYWGDFSVQKTLDLFRKSTIFNVVQTNDSIFYKFINTFLNIFFYYSSSKSFAISRDDNSKLTIHTSKRNPFETLSRQYRDNAVVAMYAWDSNSFPGNEYYAGQKNASADPAAACSTTIADLGNPFINKEGLKNLIVYNAKM